VVASTCRSVSGAGARRRGNIAALPRPTQERIDPLIRELTHYRDVIARKTQEVTP
jgi:hypothetical protein